MRIALVHDWFTSLGGAERVLIALHEAFPQAPIHLAIGDAFLIRTWLPNATIVESGLAKLPLPKSWFRALLALMPSAVESFDFSEYDVVISSSVLFSKGIVVRPGTKHVCYCYSPSRPLWDRAHAPEYRGFLSSCFRHVLRLWDYSAAQRPDIMIAPSRAVQERISKWYRRDAIVIEPPTSLGTPSSEKEPYFLVVGRCTPHKNLGALLDAFAKLRDRLIVVGTGPLFSSLQRRATPNVDCRGWVDDATLATLYARCTAVIVASEEDWGLTAVEALSYGKPVLALRAGGAIEIVQEGISGTFFDDPIPEAIADGIKRIRQLAMTLSPIAIAREAERYSGDIFVRRMKDLIHTS